MGPDDLGIFLLERGYRPAANVLMYITITKLLLVTLDNLSNSIILNIKFIIKVANCTEKNYIACISGLRIVICNFATFISHMTLQ